MGETILNIYLVINKNLVEEFRAVAYKSDEGDQAKIKFLKSKAKEDFEKAYHFDSPTDKNGKFMDYNRFHKLEKRGMHFELFEEIFSKFNVPEHPLICVTPVVDGEIYAGE
jgi:endonuclease IV